jgi:5-methyltetrahydropteroyltriglutamate--homocysteine methyltransferase
MTIETTVVGSYPAPSWLLAYPTEPHLRDAILTVAATQELAGIDVISDGELSRFDVSHPETNGMIDYFVGQLDGVRTRIGIDDLRRVASDRRLAFRRRPAGVVTAEIGPGTLNLPAAADRLRRLTRARTKFTVTSPFMLARTLADRHYGDLDKLCMAIADVLRDQVADIDADVVQVDEAHVTGHPEDGELAAAAINRVLDAVQGESAVHLCFGNYGGQTVQRGLYEDLLPFMNALHADHLLLEVARRDPGELTVLQDLDDRIGLGLGVIDIKDNAVEDPDDIAHRIEAAERTLGAGRVRYVNPDCGFWMLSRNVADAKLRALVQGRDRFRGAS